MGEFNVNKSDGSLNQTAGMPSEYPATQVMMSDGVTSVEDALNSLQVESGSFDFNASLFNTYKTVYYRKQGNVVMLSLNLQVSSAISADGVMGNVPSALRPQTRLWITGSSGSFYLETNGDFKTLTVKNVGNWIYVTMTYII